MKIGSALGSGLAGAISLTLLHEATRRVVPSAPRLDVLGMRALANTLRVMDQPVPHPTRLHRGALVGDLVANTLYYSLVGVGKDAHMWRRGTLLGWPPVSALSSCRAHWDSDGDQVHVRSRHNS
jgi:hypothetical protein